MNPRDQVNELLEKHGASLIRRKNHEVWQLPNGHKFVRGLTSSDVKADANNLSDLKHALGIIKTEAVVGERRVKQLKQRIEPKIKYDRAVNSMAEKVPISLIENSLRDEIERQQRELEHLLTLRDALQIQVDHCRLCRLKKWWHKHN